MLFQNHLNINLGIDALSKAFKYQLRHSCSFLNYLYIIQGKAAFSKPFIDQPIA